MPTLGFLREQRWASLLILCIGMLMIVLDNTVVNVALASMQKDLGFSQSALAWVVNAYMIGFAGLLLLGGRLGDLVGSKRVFLWGIAIFTLGSLACGAAFNGAFLVGARFVQGLGGALASAVILAMIFTSFTDEAQRAKALNLFSFTASAGGSVGLLIGGILTQLLNWHWIFLVNVPIGIAAFTYGMRILPSSSGAGLRAGADALGAALVTASLMLGVYAVVQVPVTGISAQTGAVAVASVLLMIAFAVRQRVAKAPLIPLHVFRSRLIVASNAQQLFVVAGAFAFFFLYSLYLRNVLGYDAVRTGLAFLPVTVAIGGFSLGPGAWCMARFGPSRPLVWGLVMAACGLAVFAVASPQAPYVAVALPAMALIGIGFGVSFPCVMTFAMVDAKPQDSGLVSGLINTTGEAGGTLGVAALAAVAAARAGHLSASGASGAAALVGGYRLAFAIAAALLVLAVIIAALYLRTPQAREEEKEAAA